MDGQTATMIIQENRAIPLRRDSLSRVTFKIIEGHNTYYWLYRNTVKEATEITEIEATIQLKDKVRFGLKAGNVPVTLTGTVVVVVPAKKSLLERLESFRKSGYNTKHIETDLRRRQQISYLVAIGKVLYWPLISTIRKLDV